jgi:hypothetical protein
MDAFINSTTWHYQAFLKTGSGDVWRVWFDHDGQPNMEKLVNMRDYPEALEALITSDPR